MERIELGADSWLELTPRLVDDEGEGWFDELCRELPLATETYRMGAREVTSPRLVSWHGDPGATYRYSGRAHSPLPWTARLSEVRRLVEAASSLRFNAVLANLYRDGADGMGWHSDGEPEIGPHPDDRWVASLSLGHPRRFLLRANDGSRTLELELGHGTLLVMRGRTQSRYRHAVPKTKRPVGPRLNLTFRHLSLEAELPPREPAR